MSRTHFDCPPFHQCGKVSILASKHHNRGWLNATARTTGTIMKTTTVAPHRPLLLHPRPHPDPHLLSHTYNQSCLAVPRIHPLHDSCLRFPKQPPAFLSWVCALTAATAAPIHLRLQAVAHHLGLPRCNRQASITQSFDLPVNSIP